MRRGTSMEKALDQLGNAAQIAEEE